MAMTFSNEDDETVTCGTEACTPLVKTATPATYDAVGDVISYSYLRDQQRQRDLERSVHGE